MLSLDREPERPHETRYWPATPLMSTYRRADVTLLRVWSLSCEEIAGTASLGSLQIRFTCWEKILHYAVTPTMRDPEQHRNRVTAIKLISDPKLWRLEIFGNLPNVALTNVIKPELSYKPYC